MIGFGLFSFNCDVLCPVISPGNESLSAFVDDKKGFYCFEHESPRNGFSCNSFSSGVPCFMIYSFEPILLMGGC